MDGIGDFLTIIRNAVRAKLASTVASYSKMRCALLQILKSAGYVDGWDEFVDDRGHRCVRVHLRYVDGRSPIVVLERCSKPGRRLYVGAKAVPRILNGLGIAIVSTSHGLMRDSEARRRNVGGELLCRVY
ncbi:MAG: 30S ribosomal protein S8 [Puniceicoccales bacterium]|jgi:small subunit ribosomal protein S8|nr:30S ribosomal protein S8 [Puniceicoccales bacterium]